MTPDVITYQQPPIFREFGSGVQSKPSFHSSFKISVKTFFDSSWIYNSHFYNISSPMTITAPISRLLKYRTLPAASRSSSGALRPLRALRIRTFASEAKFDPESVERAQDEVDVCIVGGGPAGLSAAIRLKQLEQERGGDELRVVVLEKGGEVGELNIT